MKSYPMPNFGEKTNFSWFFFVFFENVKSNGFHLYNGLFKFRLFNNKKKKKSKIFKFQNPISHHRNVLKWFWNMYIKGMNQYFPFFFFYYFNFGHMYNRLFPKAKFLRNLDFQFFWCIFLEKSKKVKYYRFGLL